ncbi:MAG: hypothetical protein R3F31_27255 [Verrucomicrobiales bacterium]
MAKRDKPVQPAGPEESMDTASKPSLLARLAPPPKRDIPPSPPPPWEDRTPRKARGWKTRPESTLQDHEERPRMSSGTGTGRKNQLKEAMKPP